MRKVLLCILLVALGFSLTADLPSVKKRSFFGDEATYWLAAQSLAYDHDPVFKRGDLERVMRDFPDGPRGLVLARKDLGLETKLVYAKGLIYPLLVSPWVRLFGTKGFLVFHTFLLALVLVAGMWFWRTDSSEPAALGWTAAFVFASVLTVHFFWVTPEFLSFSLVFLATFLWLPRPGAPPQASSHRSELALDLATIALYSLATRIGPVFNGFAVAPLLIFRARGLGVRRIVLLRPIVLAATFALLTGGLAWAELRATGGIGGTGGDIRIFDQRFPFQDSNAAFQNLGKSIRVETLAIQPSPLVGFLGGWAYYFFGRFEGIVWYFFPIVVAILAFARSPTLFPRGLIAAVIAAEVGAAIFARLSGSTGAGWGFGDRAFLGILPLFFFLPARTPGRRGLAACWIAAAVLIAPALTNPLLYSARPDILAKEPPLRWLPWNRMRLGAIPTSGNSRVFDVPFGNPPRLHLYFLDDNSWGKEGEAFWVRGGEQAEMALRTERPLESLTLRLTSGVSPANRVRVYLAGEEWDQELQADETVEITLKPRCASSIRQGTGTDWIYKFLVRSRKGVLPALDRPGERDVRFLGVKVELAGLAERSDS